MTVALAPGGLSAAEAGAHNVIAGLLNVEQISEVDSNLALVTLTQKIGSFRVNRTGCNRGDYNVLINPGIEAQQDENNGVLLSSVTENGRDNFGTNGYPSSAIERTGGGTYRIVSYLSPGIEYNVNVAGAWFPYDQYLGGLARNATALNGGTNDTFTGSAGLVLGTHFKGVSGGISIVDLTSLGIDSRTDGVLLVNHAKDEDNFALSQVNTNDGTWNVFVRDIGQGTYSSYEQDPVAFVFIPQTNAMLISGRFRGDGTIEMFSGSTPQFTVTNVDVGCWDLEIPGHSPTNGILIISAEGGGVYNGDNIVSYQAHTNGTGWVIQSRDTPKNGLQTCPDEAVASFVYIPVLAPGFKVQPTDGLVTTGSGGTAAFSVVLQTAPTAVVTLEVASNDATKGVASPAILTFDVNDWYVPNTVTVTGQDGAAEGGYSIVLSPASSADPAYEGLDPDDVVASSLAARAAVVWPIDYGVQVSTSPPLQAMVTNTMAGNLTVTFYGRVAPTVHPGPDFCISVMPDTQMYTGRLGGGHEDMMISQTEWAISNRVSRNIAYVTQLGDISNNGDSPSYIQQWYRATNAMYRLEDPARTQLGDGIAYGVAVGNHEITPIGQAAIGTTSNYNRFFGVSHFSGREYYAGHYGTNNNNHFDFFSAGGLDFLVLYFEYNTNPPPELLAWADEVLATNAHRRAIAVTHNFGNTQTPVVWSAQARAIYDALKGHTNLFLFLGGHVTGQGWREDTYNGHTIRTLVQDYQGWTNGGNGFLRILDFSPSNNVVVAQCFSTVTGEYLTDEFSEFYFPYDLQPTGPGTATPFVALATNAAAPGDVSACLWSGLETNKAYEWYVAVTDQWGATVVSPVWRFTTATTNTPPSVVNLAGTVSGDGPTTLVLLASDANGDALTFQTHTVPTQGVIGDFDPATGAFTYWPAYGYRGTDRFTFSANDGQANSGVATMNLNVAAPPDADTNGLPDAWEAAYGLSDPNDDADGDGQSNLAECQANTNPTNAASLLQITDWVRLTNGHVSLAWPSIGGVRYRVQFRNGSALGGVQGAFTDLVRPLTNELDFSPYGAPAAQAFTDDFTLTGGSPTNHSRYYRIRVVR
ncbi:MAG TPA: Ig-like domain-containing protein [Verrucomicrobiota bacterium]|nr:Ig-like domain-containing protein [Verrucomicrobiota bacterium]HQL79492.1 Ig-like domain-containing protein [Verrucomicrobiota bacterium]